MQIPAFRRSDDHVMLRRCVSSLWQRCSPGLSPRPPRRRRATGRRLEVGSRSGVVEQLPDEFIDYACGTNGGPPGPLAGWRGALPGGDRLARGLFPLRRRAGVLGQGQQPAPADGAIFRHQDLRLPHHRLRLDRRGGTLRGIRLVSDPRATTRTGRGLPLRIFHRASAATDGRARRWPEEGETPVDGIFVKERCRRRSTQPRRRRCPRATCARPGRPAHRPRPPGSSSMVRFELGCSAACRLHPAWGDSWPFGGKKRRCGASA